VNAPANNIAMIAFGTAPIHTLRPILFRLVQGGALPRVHSQLLQALQRTPAEDYLESLIPQLQLDPSISPYASFREGVVRQLFGSDVLLRLRLKLAIADFCRVRSSPFRSSPASA
jgi:general transcription factor 3C protein 4